jgi:hypothetical protein
LSTILTWIYLGAIFTALAGDLAASGIRNVVLERRTEESNHRPYLRRARPHAGVFDARGLADELVEQGAGLGPAAVRAGKRSTVA